MSLPDQEEDFSREYEQDLENRFNQNIVNDESLKVNSNSALSLSKPLTPFVWNGSDIATFRTPSLSNSLSKLEGDNYSFNPDAAHGFNDTWRNNFEMLLGPNNAAFVDATLKYEDSEMGYCLEYNPNGILWRVSSTGIPHPDDYDNFIEQQRVIEGATNRTMEKTKELVNCSQVPFDYSDDGSVKSYDELGNLLRDIDKANATLYSKDGNKIVYGLDRTVTYYNSQGNMTGKVAGVSITDFDFSKYNRSVAASYALAWASGNNAKFPPFQYDCTSFVSQCLYYGGIPMTSSWYYRTSLNYSNSWAQVEPLATYLTTNGYGYITTDSLKVQMGDVVQLYNSNSGGWHHSMFVDYVDDSGEIYVCAHSNPTVHEKLSEVLQRTGDSICIWNPSN